MDEMIEFRIPRDRYLAMLPTMPDLRRYLSGDLVDMAALQFWNSNASARRFYEMYSDRFNEAPSFPYQKRKYAATELAAAEVLLMFVWSLVETTGREHGTLYDESTACPVCTTGATQVSEMIMDLSLLPRQDVVMTLAGEILISERLGQMLAAKGLSGVKLGRIRSSQTARESRAWRQLFIASTCRLSEKTRFGIDPFDSDDDGKYRCTRCGIMGARRTSEAFVLKKSWPGTDFSVTMERVGVKLGLYEPWPLILVSPQAYRAIESGRFSGVGFEVAHLA